ncbi:MAG: hypothetical protein NTW94_07505 [Legionellales bacterium]|nr:hypothetical protein [Legionellales bacterium]
MPYQEIVSFRKMHSTLRLREHLLTNAQYISVLATDFDLIRARLKTPRSLHFYDALHEQIYKDILLPYENICLKRNFIALFSGYTPRKMLNLRNCQTLLNQALVNISEIIRLLIKRKAPHIHLQIEILNLTLSTILEHMHHVMPWHKELTKIVRDIRTARDSSHIKKQFDFNFDKQELIVTMRVAPTAHKPLISEKTSPHHQESPIMGAPLKAPIGQRQIASASISPLSTKHSPTSKPTLTDMPPSFALYKQKSDEFSPKFFSPEAEKIQQAPTAFVSPFATDEILGAA